MELIEILSNGAASDILSAKGRERRGMSQNTVFEKSERMTCASRLILCRSCRCFPRIFGSRLISGFSTDNRNIRNPLGFRFVR